MFPPMPPFDGPHGPFDGPGGPRNPRESHQDYADRRIREAYERVQDACGPRGARGPRGPRNAEHTRRTVLEAAMRLLQSQGLGASIQSIAAEAGVTKSGLMHHFGNRTELLTSAAKDSIETFRNKVLANIDLSENHPGKLLRAYIRTLFDNLNSENPSDPAQLWTVLAPIPEITELLTADAAKWRTDLAADGLHPDRITLALSAAKGFVHDVQLDSSIDAETITRTKEVILELTNTNEPLITKDPE